jgi:hypothetical protein
LSSCHFGTQRFILYFDVETTFLYDTAFCLEAS